MTAAFVAAALAAALPGASWETPVPAPGASNEVTGLTRQHSAYAAERVLVTRLHDGSEGFNYSATVGHALASVLTMTYYPGPSANVGVAAKTFGLSLAGLAGGHLVTEFWPDVKERLFHRHELDRAD
ncbi:MAG: hypothetical protein JOY95_05350 [Silvibacterium sp.]|nr:hypothetical protein [Silvibacterium sp.]